ncbi:MAG: hypothetical protein WCA44_05120, partial [Acidobacteriaceae bacterium]
MMGRYWTLLTDLRQSEIDKMNADIASGALHPMQAKTNLARTIVAGFYGQDAAQQADENWSKMFQEKTVVGEIELVFVEAAKIRTAFSEAVEQKQSKEELLQAQTDEVNRRHEQGESRFSGAVGIYSIVKLIRELGLASATEAAKLIKAGAVSIDDVKQTTPYYTRTGLAGPTASNPLRLTVRVGKRAKVAVIQ